MPPPGSVVRPFIPPGGPTSRLVALGPGLLLVALGIIALGIRQIVTLEYVRLAPISVPPEAGYRTLAVALGALITLLGAGLLSHRWATHAALLLGALLALNLLAGHGPIVAASPRTGFVWTNPAKHLALIGGLLLIACPPGARRHAATHLLARVWVGGFLLLCGIQHFVYAGFVDTLVPAWIPPSARFWTVFTGVALIAGGIGLAVPRTVHPAAYASAAMVFAWVWLLHVPRAVALASPGEWDGVCEALVISGAAWMIAGTSRRPPAGPDRDTPR